MITAKNYAAQAERDLRSRKDNRFVYEADLIASSQHFVLPDNGVLFDDNLKGLLGRPLFLPFESITIEFALQPLLLLDQASGEKLIIDKQLCLASETDGFITVKTVLHVKDKGWTPQAIYFKVPNSESFQFGLRAISCGHDDRALRLLNQHFKSPQTNGKVTDEKVLVDENLIGQASCLFELIESLSCRNVSTTNHQDEAPSNAKRIKVGKLPFYETKMLVVDTNPTSSGKPGTGGSHSTPRQHLRRGHIRRLGSGNIWVNSCVVGDAAKGSINKTYVVK